MDNLRSIEKISWTSHPTIKGVRIKPLITAKDHHLNMTCMLVDIPAGVEVPEHIHENQDDILYPLAGKGVMHIDGSGPFTLEPGIIVRVPKGTKHKITDITENLLLHDLFSPALF